MHAVIQPLLACQSALSLSGEATHLRRLVSYALDKYNDHHFALKWLREMTYYPNFSLYANRQITANEFVRALNIHGIDYHLANSLVEISEVVLFGQVFNGNSECLSIDYELHRALMHGQLHLLPLGMCYSDLGFRGVHITPGPDDIPLIQLNIDGKTLNHWHIPHVSELTSVLDKLQVEVERLYCCNGFIKTTLAIWDVKSKTLDKAMTKPAAVIPAFGTN